MSQVGSLALTQAIHMPGPPARQPASQPARSPEHTPLSAPLRKLLLWYWMGLWISK